MTFFLIGLLAAVFSWEAGSGDMAGSVLAGALIPYNLTHDVSLGVPVWLTPFTSLGLHAGLLHVASNALVLLAVGPAMERRCGPANFFAYFVLAGVAGGLAQAALDPGSHRPIIGASGAISGLLGGYIIRYPLAIVWPGLPAALPILAWAAVQCVQSGVLYSIKSPSVLLPLSASTAYAAHVGGFVFGALTVGLFERGRRPIG